MRNPGLSRNLGAVALHDAAIPYFFFLVSMPNSEHCKNEIPSSGESFLLREYADARHRICGERQPREMRPLLNQSNCCENSSCKEAQAQVQNPIEALRAENRYPYRSRYAQSKNAYRRHYADTHVVTTLALIMFV